MERVLASLWGCPLPLLRLAWGGACTFDCSRSVEFPGVPSRGRRVPSCSMSRSIRGFEAARMPCASLWPVRSLRERMGALATPARRNFVARKEGCSNTWINHFYPYIRDYGDPNNAVLTSDECWSIPNDVKCAAFPRSILPRGLCSLLLCSPQAEWAESARLTSDGCRMQSGSTSGDGPCHHVQGPSSLLWKSSLRFVPARMGCTHRVADAHPPSEGVWHAGGWAAHTGCW